MKVSELRKMVEEHKERSYWKKGVKEYALEMLDNMEEDGVIEVQSYKELKESILNGAEDFKEMSYGGRSLIYDGEIAFRLCTPSELKRTKCGKLNPNTKENWLDVQARALNQAYRLLYNFGQIRGWK